VLIWDYISNLEYQLKIGCKL